jgi:[ribosomal protein S5]-alanine N-acetyltransferase
MANRSQPADIPYSSRRAEPARLRWQDDSEVTSQLTTRRLDGRPLAESDFGDLYLLHRDLPVLSALGVDTPLSAEETREFLNRKLAHWREHGFGIWMFRDPAGAFVGRCGIHRWSLDEQPEVEIGYVVSSRAWGQGFAPEMVRPSSTTHSPS